MEYYILDEDGNEVRVDMHTWAVWFQEQPDARRIAETRISEEVLVSTVFIGVKYVETHNGSLYETMIFGGPLHGELKKCSTREAAEKAHEAMVSRVTNHKG